ncbi:DUF1367 family protein [Endozoicomonas gorgoniicola]|uniref:DUF1367 family protein n=1 Tax=Endozoicomonas gorgoniicola TaxID=1234144 RepID=A0ABT3N4G5_9GAMM|nr:DUF1367 family protein [Endozoicomonas gorgoniicola]MCW7556511.1 DUF1367 family protein [Endozoicomonas gorgoniicola]
MPELTLIKRLDGSFVPATHQDAQHCEKIKVGAGIRAEWKQKRNIRFHRKYFALLNIGFDAFDPGIQEYKGFPVQKSFERYRKDVICAAGFYDVIANLNGDVRREAHSISFGRMSPEQFEELYSKSIDVTLQRVLTNYTHSDLDQQVNRILGMC